jgi:hypothetical protein
MPLGQSAVVEQGVLPPQAARQVVSPSDVVAHLVESVFLPHTAVAAGVHLTPPPQHLPAVVAVPPQQLPFLHSPARSHLWRAAASATFGVKLSAPPTRAAPINLSALPRVMLPLASPLVSSSKEWLEVSWLTCAPYPEERGLWKPRPVDQRREVWGVTRLGATSENPFTR